MTAMTCPFTRTPSLLSPRALASSSTTSLPRIYSFFSLSLSLNFLLRVCMCLIVECEFAVPMTYVRNRRGRLSMLMMSSLLFKKLSFPTVSVLLKPHFMVSFQNLYHPSPFLCHFLSFIHIR